MGILDKAIDENTKITDEDIRKLMHDTWDSIYHFLGSKNFLRWVNMRELSSRLRELAIEEFSQEDKDYYASRGIVPDGYYSSENNAIKHRSLKSPSAKKTNRHESYHFASDNNKKFAFRTFINEGLTEYLNILSDGAFVKDGRLVQIGEDGKEHPVSYSYSINVQIVMLLHKVLGDSLIKAYLVGETDKEFDERFASLISEDGIPDKNLLQAFYDNLEDIHKKYYGGDEHKGKDISQQATSINHALENMILHDIEKRARQLEFYDGRTLNIQKIYDELNSVFRLYESAALSQRGTAFITAKQNIYLKGLEAIIHNSHLANNPQMLMDVLNTYNENSKAGINESGNEYISTQGRSPLSIELLTQVIGENAECKDPTRLVESQVLESKTIPEFMSRLSNIAKLMNLDETDIERVTFHYLKDRIPEEIDRVLLIKEIQKNLARNATIEELRQKAEKETIENNFYKLDSDTYVQREDGTYYIMFLGRDGSFKREKMSLSYEDAGRTYVIILNGKRISLDANGTDTPSFKISNKHVKRVKIIDSYEELQDDIFMESIRHSFKDKRYYRTLNDAMDPYAVKGVSYTADVDMRTRIFDLDSIAKDITSILAMVPEKQREDFISEFVEEKISRTYGASKNDKASFYYSKILAAVQKIIKGETLTEKDEEDVKKAIENLNKQRQDRVRESSKHAAINFANDEAERQYITYRAREQARKEKPREDILSEAESKLLKMTERMVLETKRIPFKERKPGEGLVGAFNMVTSIYTLDIKQVVRIMNLYYQKLTEKERDKVISRVTTSILRKYYGDQNTSNKEIKQSRAEVYDALSKQIIEAATTGKEIDLASYREQEKKAHELLIRENLEAESKSLVAKIPEKDPFEDMDL